MSAFRYRAATAEGQVLEGQLQAASQKSALEELRRQRLYPIELAPLVETKRGARSTGKAEAVALLARTVATMLSAGVPLDRALAFSAGQSGHSDVAAAARSMNEAVRAGAGFGEALSRHPDVFTPVFVAMANAGEESGALDEAMTRLADQLDEWTELRAQMRSALLYPALMALASGLGILVLLLFVVPRFVGILEGEGGALPLSTQILVAVSTIVVRGWWIILILTGAAVFAVRSWLLQGENRRKWHAWRLQLPVAGELEQKYATARFARVLGMLLKSGRPVLSALRIAREAVSNLHITQAIESATDAVSQGKRVSTALGDALPPLASELIAIGEESGRLEDMTLQIANAYDADVKRSLRSAVAIIEPALILLFALIVGFVALAMLQAIYSINQSAI